MIELLVESLLFFLPAGIANMTPVLVNKIPVINVWNTPLDFGLSFRGRRIFGDNKRWRGLIFGAITGGLTALLLELSVSKLLPYDGYSVALLAGLALGAGALLGDALESFFKRQIGIPSGNSWFPFDQLDYIVGGLAAVYPIVSMSIHTVLAILFIYFGLHLISSYLGYLLKLKDKPI